MSVVKGQRSQRPYETVLVSWTQYYIYTLREFLHIKYEHVTTRQSPLVRCVNSRRRQTATVNMSTIIRGRQKRREASGSSRIQTVRVNKGNTFVPGCSACCCCSLCFLSFAPVSASEEEKGERGVEIEWERRVKRLSSFQANGRDERRGGGCVGWLRRRERFGRFLKSLFLKEYFTGKKQCWFIAHIIPYIHTENCRRALASSFGIHR